MNSIEFQIAGIAPILLHSDRGLDPLNDKVRQIKAITSKSARSKTEEDIITIMKLEWELAIHHCEEMGPFVPATYIEANIRDAGRTRRLGKHVQRGLHVDEDKIKLVYDGPRDLDALWADARFRDVRGVVVSGRRINRTRPRFEGWSLTFTAIYDAEQLDRDTLIELVQIAGRNIGLGDYRPRFGRFDIVAIDGKSVQREAA